MISVGKTSFMSGGAPPAPSNSVGSALARAITLTNPSSSSAPRPSAPAPMSAFLTRAVSPLQGAGAALAAYTPPVLGSTAVPVAEQTSKAGSVSGILAKLAQFSAPLPAKFGAGAINAPAPAPVTGFDAPLVFAGAPQKSALQFRPMAADPGFQTSLPTVMATRFTGAAMPPAQPPVTAATIVSGASAQPSGTALPAASTIPAGPGGGFDPGVGWADGAYLDAANAAATPATATDYGKIALYGGGALVGLFVLSKMFGGGNRAAA